MTPEETAKLTNILPAIVAALERQRRPDRPLKVAFAPSGHIEAIITLCDDGPVVSVQNSAADDEDKNVSPSNSIRTAFEPPF
jgi:hypothetical protein